MSSSISNFFNTLYRCTFAYDKSYLTEGNHIIDGFDEVAYKIAMDIRSMWNDLRNEKDIQSAVLLTQMEYSSFNMNNDYPNEYKQFIRYGGEAPSVVNQLNDETEPYPIFYQLEWFENDTRYAYIDYRDFENKDTVENIFLHINVANFRKMFTEKVFYLLISSISHELQHAFDMYVVPYNNPLDYSDRSLMMLVQDVISKSSLSNDDARNVKAVCGLFSKDEISARLAELKSFVKLVTNNKDVCDDIFYDVAMRIYPTPFKHLDHDSNEKRITKALLIKYIARNEYIQRISRINMFHNVLNVLFSKENKDELIALIGYCLFNKGMINLVFLSDNDKHIVKQTFKSLDNVLKGNIEQCVIECVIDTMKSLFDDYVTSINKMLMDNFDNFYKTMNLDSILVEATFSTSDEIILIPMNE